MTMFDCLNDSGLNGSPASFDLVYCVRVALCMILCLQLCACTWAMNATVVHAFTPCYEKCGRGELKHGVFKSSGGTP
jgi:hypothetical protein